MQVCYTCLMQNRVRSVWGSTTSLCVCTCTLHTYIYIYRIYIYASMLHELDAEQGVVGVGQHHVPVCAHTHSHCIHICIYLFTYASMLHVLDAEQGAVDVGQHHTPASACSFTHTRFHVWVHMCSM